MAVKLNGFIPTPPPAGLRKPSVSQSKRAGLIFPPVRVRRMLKEGRYVKRTNQSACVLLTAVLEELTVELLTVCGEAATLNKKQRITPRHVISAVNEDEDFQKLFSSVVVPLEFKSTARKLVDRPVKHLLVGGELSGNRKAANRSVKPHVDPQEAVREALTRAQSEDEGSVVGSDVEVSEDEDEEGVNSEDESAPSEGDVAGHEEESEDEMPITKNQKTPIADKSNTIRNTGSMKSKTKVASRGRGNK